MTDETTTILLYHRVVQRRDAEDPLAVTVDTFERHMRFLKGRNLLAVGLGELGCPHTETPPGERPVGLTFDDGYRDFLLHAYPVLERLGFSATVFVVTSRVGDRADWTGFEHGWPLLDWGAIRDLCAVGVEFGSHTRTHPRLDRLSHDRLRDEIRGSKEDLEQRIGQAVNWLSYPYGISTARVRRVTRQAGYDGAVGVLGGTPGPFNRMRIECRETHGRLRLSLMTSPGAWRIARLLEKRHWPKART